MLSTRKTIITNTQKKVLNALQGKIFTFLTTKKFSPKTDFKAPVSNKRFFSSTHFVREEQKQQQKAEEENTKGGEESKQENKTESEKDKEEAARAKKAALISNLAMAGIVGFCIYAGYDWYINHKEDPLGSLMDLFTIKKYAEPSNEKLLPDNDDVLPFRKPTLVIAFEDFLITSHWTPQHGWRVLKRPGLDKFLADLSQRYEIVLFSDGMQGVADMCVQKIDQNGHIAHKLFRDSLLYSGGRYVKDLDRMNRPVHRVIIVDPKPESYHKHPDNAIPIKPWTGDPKDKTLFALIPVLDELSRTPSTTDLRELLKNKGSKSADDYASELIKSEPTPPPQPQGSSLTSWLPWGKKKQ